MAYFKFGLQAMPSSYGINAVGGMGGNRYFWLNPWCARERVRYTSDFGGNINKRLRVEYGADVFSSIA